MFYDDIITYDQPYFRYDGVRLVEPSEINVGPQFGEANVLLAFLIDPLSIDTSVVFVDSSKIIFTDFDEEVTNTSAVISVVGVSGSGVIAFNVLDSEADALMSVGVINISPMAESEYEAGNRSYTISSVETNVNNISAEVEIDITI